VPEGDRILDEIGVADARRTMMLMTETDRIASAPPPRNARVRTFCAARLNWKRPLPPGLAELDYKGSDVMIRGLGLFVREHGPCLHVRLVRKGLHVAETAQLVGEEGLEGLVTWLDEMSQEEVLREFREADIVFDQLDQSVVAMAGLDGMATGRPVIANGRPELIDPVVGAPSPICQARTPQEVAGQLRRLVFDAAERERVGTASRRYVEEHFSADSAAARLLDRLRRQSVLP
jgi:glycosyltransferase involved in cell wall biosynthesis